MRYVRIIFTALLMYTLLVGVAMAEEVKFPQDDGHIWIAQPQNEQNVFLDKLPNAVRGQDYNYTIPLQVQVGEGDSATIEAVNLQDGARVDSRGHKYEFALTDYASLPDGLSMDENGVISGVVTGRGTKTVCLQVSSDSGAADAVRYLTIAVVRQQVTVTVKPQTTEINWEKNGRYKAEFEIANETFAAEPDKYFNVTYRRISDGYTVTGALTQTYVSQIGTYIVEVSGTDELAACDYGVADGEGMLRVAMGKGHSIMFSKARYDVIRGDEYKVSVITTPADLAYSMVFEGIEGTVYGPTNVPPASTAVGKYRVTATTTASEYKQIVTTATLEIRQLEVEFEIKDRVEGDHVYWPHSATYLDVHPVGDLPEGVTFTVLYNGKPVNTNKGEYYPQDAGDYEVTIELSNPRYVAKYTPTTMTIKKGKMNFSISVFERKIIYTGEQYRPKFTKEGIDYYNDNLTIDDLGTPDVVETYRYVTEKGKYQANVILTEEHAKNYVADTSEAIFEIVDPPTLQMNDSTSPAGKGGTADSDGNYVYDGVTYPAAIWGDGANYDADKTAWFVRKSNIDPYRYGRGLGTVYGEDVFVEPLVSNRGWLDWLENADVGVYDVEYSTVQYKFNDTLTTVKTNGVIVVLPDEAVGDTNRDGYVNVGDARYLQNVVIPNISNMTSDADRLYLYRVCDVNHDGKVDADDVAAILNRKNVPLVGYYDYLDDETNRNPGDIDKD